MSPDATVDVQLEGTIHCIYYLSIRLLHDIDILKDVIFNRAHTGRRRKIYIIVIFIPLHDISVTDDCHQYVLPILYLLIFFR